MTQMIPYEQPQFEDLRALIMSAPPDFLLSMLTEQNTLNLKRLENSLYEHKEYVDKKFSDIDNKVDKLGEQTNFLSEKLSVRDDFKDRYVPYTDLSDYFRPKLGRSVKLLMYLANIVTFNTYNGTTINPVPNIHERTISRHTYEKVTLLDNGRSVTNWVYDPEWAVNRMNKYLEGEGLLEEFRRNNQTHEADAWVVNLFEQKVHDIRVKL